MQQLDDLFEACILQITGKYPLLDLLLLNMGNLNIFKIMPLVAGIFYIWEKGETGRKLAVCGLLSAFFALLAARLLQDFGPHRVRPLSSLHYNFPVTSRDVADWGSFPSGTSALAFALATSIFLYSRRLGLLSFAWAAFTVAVKLYGGFHYPSDVAAGIVVGIFATIVVYRGGRVTKWMFEQTEKLRLALPGLYIFLAFIVAFQLSTFFVDIRTVAHVIHARLNGTYQQEWWR